MQEKVRQRLRLLRHGVTGGAILPLLYLLYQWAALFVHIDICMDHGGVFDYREGVWHRGDDSAWEIRRTPSNPWKWPPTVPPWARPTPLALERWSATT